MNLADVAPRLARARDLHEQHHVREQLVVDAIERARVDHRWLSASMMNDSQAWTVTLDDLEDRLVVGKREGAGGRYAWHGFARDRVSGIIERLAEQRADDQLARGARVCP